MFDIAAIHELLNSSVAPYGKATKQSSKNSRWILIRRVAGSLSAEGCCATIPSRMPAPTESSPHTPLQEWLDRIARPIEFASRDAGAHLGAVTNLSSFISSQVLSALRQDVYSKAIEARLISLRDLFVDFHSGLPLDEQRRRLQTASVLIKALRAVDQENLIPQKDLPTQASSHSKVAGAGRSDLWNLSVRFIKGVGPKRTNVLQRLQIATVEDALWTIPWRYEDRSIMTPIGNLVPGMSVSICGVIGSCEAKRTRNRRLSLVEVGVEDQSGRMQVVFFNQPYLEEMLTVGTRVMMSGRVIADRQGWMVPRMDVAQYEIIGEDTESTLHVGRIVPIYHETKGWTSRQMRMLVRNLLADHGREVVDHLPLSLRTRQRLIPIHDALQDVHFPKTGTDLQLLERGKTPAHRRLAFEELLLLQLALASRHRAVHEEPKELRFNSQTPLLEKLGRLLPFCLTAAQDRVIREIFQDMISPRPMNRLVQGDVGSGKRRLPCMRWCWPAVQAIRLR